MKHLPILRVLAALVFVTLVSATTATHVAAQAIYVVQPGDSLSGIGALFNRSVDCLMQANAIYDPNWIYPGQILTIPDSPYNCTRYGASGNSPYYYPNPGQRFPPYRCLHRVAYGENLYRIALRYGLSYWQLAVVNRISNPNVLYAGQILVIPGCY